MDVNRYIGIPYEVGGKSLSAADCWGLCTLVYREQLQYDLDLASFGPDLYFEEIDMPKDFCLVRGINMNNQADHWGVYYKGAVINAMQPYSAAPALRKFVQRWPCIEFYERVEQ